MITKCNTNYFYKTTIIQKINILNTVISNSSLLKWHIFRKNIESSKTIQSLLLSYL